MICVSDSLKQYMQSIGHDPAKLCVVRNGVPIDATADDRREPGSTWTLGTMALFRPRKGVETLLSALSHLKKRGLPVRLRAVGGFETPAYEQQVMTMAAELDVNSIIEWTGFQTDTCSQLRQMDLFVLPSLFGEGLPMVVLESMAQGLPVIASNVDGIPEAVRDGTDGLIFTAGDGRHLADTIESLCGDNERWTRFSRAARQRQRAEFSDCSMAAGVSAVYDKLSQNAVRECSP
jgi:glycosyltransferase involved in cell wall biosynthesis